MSNNLLLEDFDIMPSCSVCGAVIEEQEELDKLTYNRSTASAEHYYCPYCHEEGFDITYQNYEATEEYDFTETFNQPAADLSSFGTKEKPLVVSLNSQTSDTFNAGNDKLDLEELLTIIKAEVKEDGDFHVVFVNSD